MARSKKLHLKSISGHHEPSLRKVSSRCTKLCGNANHEKRSIEASEKKEWKNAVCSVCMEFPHNAVLLLCSSYKKGCRPYMCATSNRFSNCLEQYKKFYTKPRSDDDIVLSSDKSGLPDEKTENSKLQCPLCRGEVKGWTVVDPARRYLNAKKRTCMQDNCSFIGTYKTLKEHVKSMHSWAPRPRDVDPLRAEKWKKLENERALSDVFSTIRSTMPGAIVVGDYVIERNASRGNRFDYNGDEFIRLPRNDVHYSGSRYDSDLDSIYDSSDHDDEFGGVRASRHVVARANRNARSRTRLLAGRRTWRLRNQARRFRDRF